MDSLPQPSERTTVIFRLVAPSGRVVQCMQNRLPSGYELRLEYEGHSGLLCSETVFGTVEDSALAAIAWRWREILQGGGFRPA